MYSNRIYVYHHKLLPRSDVLRPEEWNVIIHRIKLKNPQPKTKTLL